MWLNNLFFLLLWEKYHIKEYIVSATDKLISRLIIKLKQEIPFYEIIVDLELSTSS